MNIIKLSKQISVNIPLNAYEVVQAIYNRQQLPWNGNSGNNYEGSEILQDLFKYINSGVPAEPFFYKGDLFRIHSPRTVLLSDVNQKTDIVIRMEEEDGSCGILPQTRYHGHVTSFSKSYDFTRRVYYKVYDVESIFLHVNTKEYYGIDINAFTSIYGGYNPILLDEQEVLFPLLKDFVVKEYLCTPQQFKDYMKKNI